MISRQVGNVDLAPTLVDLANARAGRTMDGISLLPGLRNPSRIPSRVLQIEAPEPLFEGDVPVNRWDRPYSGVRTARYTYVVWTETDEEELYDREADPFQLTNLASDPAHASTKAYLAAKLAEFERCRGASCTVSP
jgi:arylsulfatase A-like enzyme